MFCNLINIKCLNYFIFLIVKAIELIEAMFCFQLMSVERLTVFAAALRVSFLLFEALRTHLKFQLEVCFTLLLSMLISMHDLE